MSGQRLTASQKTKRDLELVRDRLKPMSWPMLAAKYGLAEQSCRRIWYDWAKTNKGKSLKDFQGRDPLTIVWEIAQRYESWIEAQTDVAFSPDAHDSVRVGAINSAASIQSKLTDLLQATGILPKHLGQLRVEADIRHVAQTILTIFEEESVDAHTRARVVEALSAGASSSN